ncbi:ankyrin repeat domain-containing protein, partial [Salmonella enterica]|uniref:ankyrin repeat domain-containing protein n=1 Tax=Salmonella enterica TaxID=28901 RepID=UPI0035267613
HRAAARGHAEIVEILLTTENAAEPLQKAENGQTALHYAAQFGHLDTVKVLLDHLLSSNASNNNSTNNSSLFLAIADNSGYTPLHLAAQWGMKEVVTLLINAGDD